MIKIISVKDLSVSELQEQIMIAQEIMDSTEYNSGDYNASLGELQVAKRELKKRLNKESGGF